MDEVVIEYQLTWREWRRIFWGASTRKSISAFVLFFAFFFGVAVLVFATHRELLAIVVAIFAVVSVVSNFWIAPRRYWNSAVGVQEAKHVTISDDGILRTSDSLEEMLGWERFRSVKADSDYVILVGRPGCGSVHLPKRGLISAHDEEMLLGLIHRHVPHS